MGPSSYGSNQRQESLLRAAPNPYLETVLPIAVSSKLWWLLIPYVQSSWSQSLSHFACLCPKFREGQMPACNKVLDVITSFFTSTLRPTWTVFEETRMAKSGLVLRPTSPAEVDQLDRRQPYWILVSEEYRKIAVVASVVDLCRRSDVHHAQLLTVAMRTQQT